MNRQTDYTPPFFPWDHIIERRAWSRVLAACALSEIKHNNPRQILKSNWPEDQRASLLLKAAQSPTDTSSLPGQTSATVTWRSLSPGSAAWRLFDHPSALRLDMNGVRTINMPNVASLPVSPMFVAEGAPAPVVQWAWTNTVLGPTKKILVISAVTEELDRASPESAAAIIGRVLSDATARSIDVIAFDTNAATAVRPAGLLFGVAPITASVNTNHNEAMIEDLAALAGQIGGNGIDPTDVVYIAAPREAQTIKLRAGPRFDNDVLMSLGVPAKTIIAVAPAGIASGYQGPPKIETSTEAVVHSDTAPGEPITSPSRSFFQTNLIGIRVKAMAAWAAAPGSVAVAANVVW